MTIKLPLKIISKLPSKFFLKLTKTLAPFGGILEEVIILGARKLLDEFTNNASTKAISERDRLNSDNINDVIDYNKLLNEFINEMEEDICSLEEKVVLNCSEYYDELILLIQRIEDTEKINLQITNIKRAVERLKRDAKGSLAKSIHRKISLDNSTLKRILSLPLGQLKKDRMKVFKEDAIKDVLDDFINYIKSSIEDLSDDISEQLYGIISDARKNNEMLLKELKLLENNTDNEEHAIHLIELAEIKIILCKEILTEMRE